MSTLVVAAEFEPTFRRLRWFNLVMGVVHLVSGSAMLALANDFSLPVTTTFLQEQPGGAFDPARVTEQLSLRIGPLVAGFLLLSAFFHLLVATPWGYTRYRAELVQHRNRFRWVEYSLSASVMIVVIAMLTGITDAAALLVLFVVNASTILFGWLMELYSQPGRADWTPFVFGCVAGAAPWLAILVYLVGPDTVPTFVNGIFVSLFVLFNCFALNQWLQYRQIGPWRDYLFGERAYIVLSLVAKSALAWQVFANTLV